MRKLAKKSGEKVYWDEQICERATLDDIDEDKVRSLLNKAKRERNFRVEYDSKRYRKGSVGHRGDSGCCRNFFTY